MSWLEANGTMIVTSIMKTATVADLRNYFRWVPAWIENGESVQIIRRGKAFACLSPAAGGERKKTVVDFAARRKAIRGGRVFRAAEVEAMRNAEIEGGEG